MIVGWGSANSNGSPLTYFRILIRTSDELTYDEDLTSCDGRDSVIFASFTCTIPLANLIIPPLNLVEDDTIYLRVLAGNALGDGSPSPVNF